MSVIIATFNGQQHLGGQLRALAAQASAPQFEVIVADNGSTDMTIDVARAAQAVLAVRIVDASDRRGQAHARNIGARAARADHLLFVDQDDEVAPAYVREMDHALRAHSLVAARMEVTALNPGWLSEVREIAQTHQLPNQPVPWAYGCTLGVHRRDFEAVCGFTPDQLGGAEDVDLCWRLSQRGIAPYFVQAAVLHYRFPHTLRALFKQGRRYALADTLLRVRHGFTSPQTIWSALRGALGPCRLLIVGTPGERGRGAFLLGRRIGNLEGRFRAA